MARICRQCGKRFTESVLKHYEKQHKNVYLIYASKIASHPNMYATDEDNTREVATIKARIAPISDSKKRAQLDATPDHVKVERNTPDDSNKKQHKFNTKAIRQLVTLLENHPQEQTYRGETMFICDCCDECYSSGRVVFNQPIKNWHVCYKCYKHAKARTLQKRGNKKFWILTPM